MRSLGFLCFVVCLVCAQAPAQGIITTVAGANFNFPFLAGPALGAPMGNIWGIDVDSAGNVYIADMQNLRVFKYTADTATLSVVAGNGLAGRSGDGGPAVNASLLRPQAVALDRQGNLYIADAMVVRIISPDGNINTVAGNGEFGFSGDGQPAIQARFSTITDVEVDSNGNLYIADAHNNRIRRVSNGIVTTVAGTGTAGFGGDDGPATSATFNDVDLAMAVDSQNRIYFMANQRIRRFLPGGTVSTFVPREQTWSPRDIWIDAQDNLYLADSWFAKRISPGGTVTLIAGNGRGVFDVEGKPALSASFIHVVGIAAGPGGEILLTDSSAGRLIRINSAGIINIIAGNGLYRFSGDGGPAISASFRSAQGLARAADGSIYIADTTNGRIRRIDPNGTISTYAGTGNIGSSGDGGPAAQAQFFEPTELVFDSAGNLLVCDFNNSRVRRISPSGIITTVAGGGSRAVTDGARATEVNLASQLGSITVDAAGNIYILARTAYLYKVSADGILTRIAGTGEAGFSGDGGPATQAKIGDNWAGGIAVDSSGVIYFSDFKNHRIRRIANGIITTYIGNGTPGSAGDGGPVASARVAAPEELKFDAAGNLFIADTEGHRLRKVSGGIITTVAGTARSGFGADGIASTQSDLLRPRAFAIEPDGSILLVDDTQRVRRIASTAPSFSVTPANLAFAASANGAEPPAQTLQIAGGIPGIAWTASTASTGGAWLAIAATGGNTPGTLTVRVSPAGLAAGTYSGTINLRAPAANPSQITIAVAFTVGAAQSPRLAVEPASVTFQTLSGGDPSPESLQIRNTGGGTLTWTAQADDGGAGWLSVASASGTATPASPASLQVRVSSSRLAANTYHGSIRVTAAGTTTTVPVNLIVTAAQTQLLLSQTGLNFTAVQGDGVVPSQSFGVLNVGQGTMNWTARLQSVRGCAWLTVSPANGSSVGGVEEVSPVQVQVNVTGISAGRYSCQVRVEAAGASGSPRSVGVFLQVLPPGSVAPPQVRPSGLIFVRRAGSTSPGSQNVTLATSARNGIETRVATSTFDPAAWLSTAETSLTIHPARSGSVTVQPILGSLAPGQYFGTVDLKFRDLASGVFSSQAVEVLFIVTGASGASAYAEGPATEANGCTPSRLFVAMRSLVSSFSIPVGFPATLEAQVKDDCDNAVNNAVVVASSSTSDLPISLVRVSRGIYTGTWRPTRAEASQVSVRAQQGGLSGSAVSTFSVSAQNRIATISPGGIVHSASYARGAVAPGSIVSVFGADMAGAVARAEQIPLPRTLAESTLSIAGLDAPLYYTSPGQINAQVPFEAQPGTTEAQLSLNQLGQSLFADTENLTIVPAAPGIFATGAPDGQGVIVNLDGRIVDPSSPATAGDFVVIYATGLGAVDRPVRTGEASPVPPAQVINQPSVTIGGRTATVHFAGLTPGLVGLYQINVQIPAGVTAGSAVPVRVTQSGFASNTVTIAIR